MPTAETRNMVLAAANACEDKKAENTRILELDPMDSGFTDFFVVTTAANDRQALAIADEIEMRMKRDFGTYPNSIEGRRQGEWVLLDYVDFVVHVFQPEKRAFYDIERLRKSARSMELDELKAALKKKTVTARKRAAKKADSVAEAKPATKKKAVKKAAKSPAKKAAPARKKASKRTQK